MKNKAIEYIKNKTAQTAPSEIRTKPRPQVNTAEVLRNKKVYIMAACGKAMATMAALFKEIGFYVRGADSACFPPMRDIVMSSTDEYYDGYNLEHLKQDELVIVGNAITCDNIEFRAVQDQKIPHMSVSEALAEFFIKDRKSLVVTGTHGKTTTTGLLAHVFEVAGKNPGYLIGGVISNNQKSFSAGMISPDPRHEMSDYFITEGDEYNAALFDRGPKFLHYRPHAVIVTSVEYDHADLYLSMDDYRTAFQLMIEEVPQNGLVVLEGDKSSTEYLKQYSGAKVVTYGFGAHNNVRAENVKINLEKDCQEFDLVVSGRKILEIQTSLFGDYNISNILAVCAVALNEGVFPEKLAEGVKTFKGMKRRQELVYQKNGVTVIDDYAHHPTAVALTLKGIKQRYPNRRIIALFEPYSSTSRSHLFEKPYADAFSALADISMFHIPALTTENPTNFVNGRSINQHFLDNGKKQDEVYIYEGQPIETLYEQFKKIIRKGDVVVVMASYKFGNIVEKIQKDGIDVQ
ncbi:MAG: Mur ligase family protein [bacterium]